MKAQGHLLTALPLVVPPMEPPARMSSSRMQMSSRLRYSSPQQRFPGELHEEDIFLGSSASHRLQAC